MIIIVGRCYKVVNFIMVEDNKFHINRTKEIIVNYMMKNSLLFDILIFSNFSDKLIDIIENHDENHIYILDYELPDCTAIDIARMIRQYDWTSPIIIFTVNGGLALDSFKQRLQILDFVDKQVNAEKNLDELFDICLSQLKIRKTLKFTIGATHYSIDYDKIKYIYRDTSDRKSIVVTDTDEYSVNKTLIQFLEKLDDKRFMFTHNACICNMNKVVAFNWKDNMLTLADGEEIFYLSKSHKTDLEPFFKEIKEKNKRKKVLEEEKKKYS